MWSNAFCQTLELDFPDPEGVAHRFFGFNIRRIVAHASGAWSLQLRSGVRLDARLRHGWIAGAGHVVGLRWVTNGQRSFVCGLWCADPRRDGWRRLLVRLRVPPRP